MEYADGGSVQDIIDAREDEDVCLTEAQIVQITAQVLKALEYLHKALENFKKNFGEEHPYIPPCYFNLGETLSYMGRREEAKTYFEADL